MGRRGVGSGKLEDLDLGYLGPTDPTAAAKSRLWYFGVFAGAMMLDVGCGTALYFVIHWGHLTEGGYDLSVIWKALTSFKSNTLDLIALSIGRILLLLLFAHIASSLAFAEGHCQGFDGKKPKEQKQLRAQSRKWTGSLSSSNMDLAGLSAPLLTGNGNGNGHLNGFHVAEPVEEEREDKNRVIEKKIEVDMDDTIAEWVYSVSPKDAILFCTFLSCTIFQIYVGAKCVSFKFRNEAVEGLLMGSTVVWINCESTLLSSLAYASGVLGRAIGLADKVSLKPTPSRNGAIQITSSPHGSKQTSFAELETLVEGQLRGDKGVREEVVVDPRSYLMRAISLAKQELGIILLGFLFLGVTSAASLILPKYQGKILDDVIMFNKAAFLNDVLLMTIFSLITGIFGGLRGLCFSVVGKRVLKTLQDRLFGGVIIQDVAYFDSTTSGELTSRLTNDVSAMAEPLNWQLSTLVRNFTSLAGGILLCFWTSWKLSMLAFTTMAPIMYITVLYSRWSRDLNRKRYAVLAEANSAASEALGNIRTVRAFSTEDLEMERYQSKTMAAMNKGVRDAFAYSGAVAVNNWLDLGASVLILWYGGVLVMEGHLSIGRLITFQLYWNLIQEGYQSIMSVLMSLTRASGAAQRVLSLIDALPDIDPNAGTAVSALLGDVAIENVHFHYQMRPDHPVLTGVDLRVGPGQVCALVGRSGGGKSTIVHLLMRFYDPSLGRILFDGQDVRGLNLKSVHRQMGLVAQDTQLWATTIEDNITYGVDSYTKAELEAAARYANAHDFISKFPEGYATRVGERGVRLSGGQRQRIAIARMLLRKPSILLLDEATSALDTESESLVQAALDRLLAEGGRTVVLVAHRLSTVKNAHIIAVIDKGTVVEKGNHEELLEKPNGVYGRLVHRQLSKMANEIQENGIGKEEDIDSLLGGK